MEAGRFSLRGPFVRRAEPPRQLLVQIRELAHDDTVGDPVLLTPTSSVDEPARRGQLAEGEAEVDLRPGGRLDLGDYVTPVRRYNGLPEAKLHVRSERERQLLLAGEASIGPGLHRLDAAGASRRWFATSAFPPPICVIPG
jgi:hypothetical protein